DLQRVGYGVEDGRANAGGAEDDDDDAVDDRQPHRLRPGDLSDHGDGEEGVHAQARSQGEGQTRDDSEEDGDDTRDEAGDRGQLGEVERVAHHVLGSAEDERVEHDDVGHRDEGDDASADLL